MASYDSHTSLPHTNMTHWRDSMRSPLLFKFNGNLVFLIIFTILVPSLTFMALSFILVLTLIILFKLAENRGLSPIRAARAVRSKLAGKLRPAWLPSHDRHAIDHNTLPFIYPTKGEKK